MGASATPMVARPGRPVRIGTSRAEGLSEYYVEDGDLLFTRYNGSIDLLGVAGMVRGCSAATVHPDKLIRVKAAVPAPLPAYLEIACNTGESRRHVVSRARTTAGQTGISGGDIREMPVPLPPTAEQEVIVAEVERHLSVIAAAEKYIIASLKRADRLRQSILKEAFSGRLVPQDPNDEPAESLLKRSTPGTAPEARPKPTRQVGGRRAPRELVLRRGAVASYIVKRLHGNPSFGRTQLVKALHLSQAHVGLDLGFEFKRHQLGPLDEAVYKVEGLAKKMGWFVAQGRKTKGVTYRPGPDIGPRCEDAVAVLGDRRPAMDRLLDHLAAMTTDQAELFSTVYAAWNDLLLDGRPADDAGVVAEVYGWHESKKKFARGDILARLAWMRDNGYVPTGTGPCTQALPTTDDGTAR